jgi:SAM-dependent methyltransferase
MIVLTGKERMTNAHDHVAPADRASMPMTLDAEAFSFLHAASMAMAAVDAARQLWVFRRLAHGSADLPTLIADCRMSRRGALLLLTALANLGLVSANADGVYHLTTPTLVMASAPGDNLAELIRNDYMPTAGDTQAGAEKLYPDIVAMLGAWFAPAAEHAAARLHTANLRVLDVGAGAAPWSLAFALRNPNCRVTAVDLPAVLAVTRQCVIAAGCQAQYEYLAGDCFGIDWQNGTYDLAITGNVCHLFGPAANRRLLERLFQALRPGGRALIFDFLPNDPLDGPRWIVLYALGLFTRTNSGQVYPFSAYANWLEETGFMDIERIDLGAAPPISMICARRPSGS